MSKTDVSIKAFAWQTAGDGQFEALTRFTNAIEAERLPGDPPRTVKEIVSRYRNTPPFMQNEAWAGWTPSGEIVAFGRCSARHGEGNQHLAECDVFVHPQWRRRGLGTKMLAQIVELPRREGRRLIHALTYGSVPAGAAFAEHCGAQRGLTEKHSQLELAQLDQSLLREWIARAPARAAGFELGCWDTPLPEAELPAIAKLFEVMNGAPRQELDLEDDHISPEEIRAWERSMQGRGIDRWVMYAREKASGEYAGFTEVFWYPDRPAYLQQGGTGVWPQYRNRGLGRWLKAAMIERVLRERPQVRLVRTDNADTNQAMLDINIQLGFKPFMEVVYWQIETEKVLKLTGS